MSTDLDRYLDHVHGDARYYLRFCALDRVEKETGRKDGEWKEQYVPYRPGETVTIGGMIERAGRDGKDVYLSAHGYVDRTLPAQKPNAAEITCLWNEADAAQLPDADDPDYPTMRIQTSDGHEHWYKRLSRGITPAQAENLTERWAQHRGGDSGHALTKRLRPPGSRNFRYLGAPESVIIEIDDEGAVDPDDLDRYLPPLKARPSVKVGVPDGATDPADEPPVFLAPMALEVWQGKRYAVRQDGSGQRDGSRTLQWMGYGLAEGGATGRTIAAAVAERDVTLGINKYSGRADAADQYGAIATEALDKLAANQAENEPPSGAPPATDIAQLKREVARLTRDVEALQIRCRIADEQLAAFQNRNLGTTGPVAATLIQLFASETPTRLGEPACYRTPLDKLARLTGQSPDTCSRQIKTLASFTLPDGETPLIHREILDIPGGVDVDTGEIIAPRKELWIGPGVPVAEFAHAVATIDPPERKPWGGKRDDGVCADHPDDGVIERVHYQKHVSYECATCNRVLEETTETVAGKAMIRLLRHIPTRQDAGLLPTHDPEDDGPIPQDAGTLRPHPRGDGGLSRKLPDRGPIEFVQQSLAPPTADELAAGLRAWDRRSPPTPVDRHTDIARGAD